MMMDQMTGIGGVRMKQIKLRYHFLILIILCFGCNSTKDHNYEGINLRIEINKTEFKLNEIIEISYILTNSTDEDLYFLQPKYINIWDGLHFNNSSDRNLRRMAEYDNHIKRDYFEMSDFQEIKKRSSHKWKSEFKIIQESNLFNYSGIFLKSLSDYNKIKDWIECLYLNNSTEFYIYGSYNVYQHVIESFNEIGKGKLYYDPIITDKIRISIRG